MKEPLKILCIFNDVFQFYFRFLSAIVAENGTLSEEDFWSLVANENSITSSLLELGGVEKRKLTGKLSRVTG